MADTFAEGIPDSWVATLFSPGRGLFVFSPVLLVIVLLILVLWRHLNFKWTAVVGLAVIAAHWRVIASFRSWWGGASFGSRLFTDVLPWFFLLGMLALAALLTPTSKKNVKVRLFRSCPPVGTSVPRIEDQHSPVNPIGFVAVHSPGCHVADSCLCRDHWHTDARGSRQVKGRLRRPVR